MLQSLFAHMSFRGWRGKLNQELDCVCGHGGMRDSSKRRVAASSTCSTVYFLCESPVFRDFTECLQTSA